MRVVIVKHTKSRIPENMVTEVLTEATRLQNEANQGFSREELEQVCLEAGISADLFQAAVRAVEEKRRRQAEQRQQLRKWLIQQAKRGFSVGMALLIPAIALSNLFIQLALQLSDDQAIGKINWEDRRDRSEVTAISEPKATSEPPPAVIPVAEPEPAAISEPEPEPKAISAPKITPEPEEPPVTRKPKAPPAPVVASEPVGLREVFRSKVVGKTQQDVMQSVGEPAYTSESAHSNATHWKYKNVKDPESGELKDITVIFEDGVVDGVFFHR